MDILQYLIELLKIRKEIGIEGLGTLYKKKTPGRYDAELHSFVPPSYVLEFTNDVKEHFNLTQYIQSKRSISEESAKYFINDFVQEVQKGLAEAGTYDLKNLGRFIFENAQITFHPTHDINIGFDFFALPSFTGELTPPHTTADSHIESTEKTEVQVEEVAIDSREQSEEIENVASANFTDEELPNTTVDEDVAEIPLVEKLDEASTEVPSEEESEVEHIEANEPKNEEVPLATTVEEVAEIPVVEELDEASNEFPSEEKSDVEHIETDEPKNEEALLATTVEEVAEIPLVEEFDEASNEFPLQEEPEVEPINADEPENEEVLLETTVEEVTKEDIFSTEESTTEAINDTHSTKTFEENDATQDEVYEEIAEVGAFTEVNESTVEDTTWDFNDEHVISQEDIQEEKLPLAEDGDEDNRDTKTDHKKQGIKIKASTQSWDFDSAADTDNSLDHNEVGEFYGIDEPDPTEYQTEGMSLYKKLTIGILAVGVIIAAIYLYNPEIISELIRDKVTNPDQKMAIPLPQNDLKTQQDSLSFADSIMANAEKAGLAVEPAQDTIKVTANAQPVNSTTYEIISAALGNSKEVEKYIARMKKNGFDAKVANMPGKIYKKISIASYTNRDSATKDLKKLKVRLKNSELYIFEDKNK